MSRKQNDIGKKNRFEENIRRKEFEIQRIYTPVPLASRGTSVVESPLASFFRRNTDSAARGISPVAAFSMPILDDNADFDSIDTPAALNTDKNAVESLKQLTLNSNKFMENFNPETSSRERRKLNRKIRNAGTAKRHPGALYDEHGIHIVSGLDICDCLFPDCPGCFYECPKCTATKCGLECRVNRKFVYEQVDFEGMKLFVACC